MNAIHEQLGSIFHFDEAEKREENTTRKTKIFKQYKYIFLM